MRLLFSIRTVQSPEPNQSLQSSTIVPASLQPLPTSAPPVSLELLLLEIQSLKTEVQQQKRDIESKLYLFLVKEK